MISIFASHTQLLETSPLRKGHVRGTPIITAPKKKKSHALGGSRFQPHAQRIFPAAGTLYRLGMPLVCRRVSRESASRIIGKIAAIMEMREYVCGQTSVSPSVRGASHFQEIFRVLCMDMRAFPITPALPFKAVKGIRQVVSFSCCLCGKDCFS